MNIKLEHEALNALRRAMGYTSRDVRCKRCIHFVEADLSGDYNAAAAHCTLNPATGTQLSVDPDSVCDHFRAMQSKPKAKA